MRLFFDHPTLVTITAPTCAGKNFLLEKMVTELDFGRITSTTDRAPRDGEVEGTHYFFISTTTSQMLEDNNAFAELVTYNGTRYGVTKSEMRKKVADGLPPPMVILEPSGLRQYKQYCGENGIRLFKIFIDTPEATRLERLAQRTTQDIVRAINGGAFPTDPETIYKQVAVNNKRLQAVIEQERRWHDVEDWDLIVNGTNADLALQSIIEAVIGRNDPPTTQSVEKHNWKASSPGIGGHNGEYDYTCTKCGSSDWLPRWGRPEELSKGPCPNTRNQNA